MRETCYGTLLAVLLLPGFATAEPLDDAIDLVLTVSPVLAERQHELQAVAKQSNWESRVRFGYDLKGTEMEAEGFNAGISVVIPLFDKKREIEAAKVRERLAQAEQELLRAFLQEVKALRTLRRQQTEAEEMAAFFRDRLTYHKQLEREGQIEAVALWSQAEAVKQAEHAARQAAADYHLTLETLARSYGGAQWQRLHSLLAAFAKPTTP